MSVMLHSGTVLATRAYTARPVPQQQQRLNTLFRRKVALLAYKESAPAVLESSGDVWTDHSTPQQKKAKLRAPSGPQIPKFLVKQTDYNPHDYVEVGFVWKAIGARGEVLVRVCTSLQDYRVGLAGPRYLLPWSGAPKDSENPLDTSPPPPLYRARMRRAHYKVHNIADVRHNAWQTLLEGCHINAVAQRLQGWRVFMHVADIPTLDLSQSRDCAERAAVASAQQGFTAAALSTKFQVDEQMLQFLDAEEIRDFRVYVLWRPGSLQRSDIDYSNSNKHDSQNLLASSMENLDQNLNSDNNSVSEEGIEGEGPGGKEEVLGLLESETPAWIQGATCIGRITDLNRDEKRFYDTGQYIDVLGYRALPGDSGTFRVAFQKNLVLHALPQGDADAPCDSGGDRGGQEAGQRGVERFVCLDSLQQDDLIQVENAEELIEFGHLSNGATPLWIRNAPSGLLPLHPRCLTHIDFDAEVALVQPDPQWLRDHMAVRMVKRRPPRRTESQKLTMGGKYLKRVDKGFIKKKGKYARKGRNLRKT